MQTGAAVSRHEQVGEDVGGSACIEEVRERPLTTRRDEL